MKKNVGNADKIIRLIIPAAVIVLVVFKVFTGTLALVLLIVACVLAVTSMAGFCPLYSLLGINTCPKKQPVK
jgi:hypothetical protein